MKDFELYIAYVAWTGGGKRRPVLVYEQESDYISVYKITSQYTAKSKVIQRKYFEIVDWKQAGLDMPSYINTEILEELPVKVFSNVKPIGELTERDKENLIEFLKQ